METYIYLLKYNNYFNRQVKRANTLEDYKDYILAYERSVNFNPNDGISTEVIMNTEAQGDYLLVFETNGTPSEDAEPVSRWFVLEQERTRKNQHKISLKRDVIADNLNSVLNAPCFVEKGTITDDTNPLIYNREGISLNQIKKEEILLKDGSQVPWIVGYIAKNAQMDNTSIDWTTSKNYIDVSASSLANWEFGRYVNEAMVGAMQSATYRFAYQRGLPLIYHDDRCAAITSEGGTSNTNWLNPPGFYWALKTGDWYENTKTTTNKLLAAFNQLGLANVNAQAASLLGCSTQSRVDELMSYKGHIVKFTDGSFYKIDVVPDTDKYWYRDITNTDGDLWSSIKYICENSGAFHSENNTPDNDSVTIETKAATYRVIATRLKNLEVQAKISTTRAHTSDALYDIFCMPYGAVDVSRYTTSTKTTIAEICTTNKDLQMAAAQAIATKLTSGSVYDLQILPYCPIPDVVSNKYNDIRLPYNSQTVVYDLILDNQDPEDPEPIGVILYADKANFSFDIDKGITLERPHTVIEDAETASVPQVNKEYSIRNIHFTGPTTAWYVLMHKTGGILVTKRSRATDEIIDSYLADKLSYYVRNNAKCQIKVDVGSSSEYFFEETYLDQDFYLTFSLNGTNESANIGTAWKQSFKVFSIIYENTYAYDLKISSECDVYRLVSPNYQGEFEMSLAKNKGISRFNVDCTYKPYNPYIHVNPDFKNMYGQDFDDSRGLVCNGDFSIGMINDAFAQYELQNKNYQSIFSRQIQNMDVNNAIAKQEATIQAFSGTATGVAAGAIAGSKLGPYGAAAGAVIGGVTSAVGGAMDVANLSKRQEEAKSFAIDMYGYNLRNIQALPYSITKCSALTLNNKLFPFVERYSCTDKEKEILKSKLEYDGMTVMAITTLSEFNSGYVKGQIIRLKDLADDSHMAYTIYEEINKGVYL